MKPLHAKAETLWQTLCAVLQALNSGQPIDPKDIDKVLKENRPEEEEHFIPNSAEFWAAKLPVPYGDLALEEIKRECPNDCENETYPNLNGFLYCSFTWRTSEMGEDFWVGIAFEIDNIN